MALTGTAQKLVANTAAIKHGPHMEQIIPELVIEATNIIKSTEMVIERNPDLATELTRLRDLKLTIAREKYLCDLIQARIDRRTREVAREITTWSKDKTFGPLLGKDMKLDKRKGGSLVVKWGRDKMMRALNDYNEQLVPKANELLGTDGVWSPEERKQGERLQDLQREHNRLATELSSKIRR